MYPLADGLFAPRNQWYVAAWSSEVGRKLLSRDVLNEPVVLFRTENGTAVAIGGRCPHRHFPLGKGRLVGDVLECGYHGICFGADGKATHIPTQVAIPSACSVRSYPLVERWQWLWIWMGDPTLANEALIPDHAEIGLTDPEFDAVGGIYYAVPGRYMLMHDNLFDLTHLNVLHRSSIGAGNIAEAKEVRNQGETWISSHRELKEVECPPFFASVFSYTEKIDRAFGMKLYLPCLHVGYDKFTRAASASSDGGVPLGQIRVFHAITPATTHTAHYFHAMSRDFQRGDEAYGKALISGVLPTLDEDMFATGEIEKMLGRFDPVPQEVLLRADTNCVNGRRLFEAMIRSEKQSSIDRHVETFAAGAG
jgi:vanillate O-demethylase monooxygenase subunit